MSPGSEALSFAIGPKRKEPGQRMCCPLNPTRTHHPFGKREALSVSDQTPEGSTKAKPKSLPSGRWSRDHLAYASWVLSKLEWGYCVTKRELLAVVTFLQLFRAYLLSWHCVVQTNHGTLRIWRGNSQDSWKSLSVWVMRQMQGSPHLPMYWLTLLGKQTLWSIQELRELNLMNQHWWSLENEERNFRSSQGDLARSFINLRKAFLAVESTESEGWSPLVSVWEHGWHHDYPPTCTARAVQAADCTGATQWGISWSPRCWYDAWQSEEHARVTGLGIGTMCDYTVKLVPAVTPTNKH